MVVSQSSRAGVHGVTLHSELIPSTRGNRKWPKTGRKKKEVRLICDQRRVFQCWPLFKVRLRARFWFDWNLNSN